jgi:glutathione S-transferase
MSLQLYIANKNYSSWSMRPWLLMRQLGIAFDEIKLRFDQGGSTQFRQGVARVSPAGRVPVLVDEGFAVWDSLAIAEYLHEKFPASGVWPTEARERARARCLCAEMHSGFSALRSSCPMNIEAALAEVGQRIWAEQAEVRRDVQRIDQMWSQQLAASGGPMLFGGFGAADAFYAPVASRVLTYGLPMSETAQAYVERLRALPGFAQWAEAALTEHDFIDFDEPYRKPPLAAPQAHRLDVSICSRPCPPGTHQDDA